MLLNKLFLTIALVSASFGITYAQSLPTYIPANGLVGWWPFNGNANDESGNGNHGVVTGAQLSADRYNNANQSYNFNGISDHIYVPSTGSTAVLRTTVSAWLKYTGDASGLPYDTYFQFGEKYPSDLHSMGYSYNYSAGAFNLYQPCKLTPFPNANINDSWHNVIIVQDSNIMKVYVDAVLVDTVNSTDTVCYMGTNSIWIGASPSDGQYVTGEIDDIGFWTRALNLEEIIAVYNGKPLGIENKPDVADVMLFPNPVTDELHFRSSDKLLHTSFRLFDNLGRIFHTGVIGKENHIEMKGLPAGTYYLQVDDATRKVYRLSKI